MRRKFNVKFEILITSIRPSCITSFCTTIYFIFGCLIMRRLVNIMKIQSRQMVPSLHQRHPAYTEGLDLYKERAKIETLSLSDKARQWKSNPRKMKRLVKELKKWELQTFIIDDDNISGFCTLTCLLSITFPDICFNMFQIKCNTLCWFLYRYTPIKDYWQVTR